MTGLRIAFATFAVAMSTTPLAAQAPCEIETRKPFQLTSAWVYLGKHDEQPEAADKARALQQATKVLTDNPGRIKNEAGRNFLLGNVYLRWLLDQGSAPVLRARRGDVGFADEPDGEFRFAAALDEAMAIIEREKPACADSTMRYRNSIANRVLNTSISHYNAKRYDTAIEYANASLQISPRSPQAGAAYQVLANAAQAKGDVAAAIAAYEQSLTRMGTDAASAPGRATATFNLAVLTRDHALQQAGAARTDGLRRSGDHFRRYLEIAPDGENASKARAAYSAVLQQAGDSAAMTAVYADMVANPGRYTVLSLFEAGVANARVSKFAEAASLFEVGLKGNPWHRDALLNLTSVYLSQHLPEKAAPLALKLRGIDPMNPDIVTLGGTVWQERGLLATDPKSRKAAQDSVSAYLTAASKLPARVLVTQFTVGRDGSVELAGSVENLGAKTATFTVMFDLINREGASVGSATVVAEGVAAKSVGEFRVQATGAAPVGWRYTLR